MWLWPDHPCQVACHPKASTWYIPPANWRHSLQLFRRYDCRPQNWQVAQLLLTNQRNVLHHDKRQNFKTVAWPYSRPFCGKYVILLLELILPTCVQNLMTLGSAVPVIWLEPPNILMRHMTWPRPYHGRFVIRRLWLAHSTCTSNLKSLWSPSTKMHKAMQNVEVLVVYWTA